MIFSIKKGKKHIKESDTWTETRTARGEHEEMQCNGNAERATEQQANSFKQRQSKKHREWGTNKDKAKNIENEEQTESEEQTEPEDAFNLILDYFDKTFEGMQARINKNMEPPAKKYKNQLEKT